MEDSDGPSRAPRVRLPDRTALEVVGAPVLLTVAVLVGLASAQGGYFPTSWGWAAVPLLLVLSIWLAVSGRTDADRLDALFVLALGLVVAWVGLSIAWSENHAQSVLEFERGLVLVSGCTAFLMLARREAAQWLNVAVLVAILLVCLYSLATRLFPDRLGVYDPEAEYRLSEPIGYWNGLGIFAAMGTLLGLGVATDRATPVVVRGLGAVSLVFIPVTLYFTYSRASWLALAAGFASIFAISAKRRRIVAELAVLALLPAAAIALASRSYALTNKDALLADAVHDGWRLALVLVGLSAASVVVVVSLARVERRVHPSKALTRALDATLLGAVVLAVALAVVHFGSPARIVTRAYDSFVTASAPVEQADLNRRLFTFNGNGRGPLWKVALRGSRGHRLAGTGAGTFERLWQRNGTVDFKVRDDHGLFVETLAELGVVGLILLVVMLGVPIVASLGVREVTFVPAALGAYAAFVLHAAVDWDWELSGVTLTALVIGCLLLTARRRDGERVLRRLPRVIGVATAIAAGVLSATGLVGNTTLASARDALHHGQDQTAISRADAARGWMPWSLEPWLVRGEAQLGAGDVASARASFERAISIDRNEWRGWLDLAAVTQGRERTQALRRARSLYPRSVEIAEFERSLRTD